MQGLIKECHDTLVVEENDVTACDGFTTARHHVEIASST